MAEDVDLRALASSWEVTLRAERKTQSTQDTYLSGLDRYLTWCEDNKRPLVLDRSSVNAFVADLLDAGAAPATARSRQLAVRRFSAWLTDEGELAADPLLGIKAPKLDTAVVQPLSDDDLKRLLAACKGRDLRDRRDEAIVRLMMETGLRAGEVVAMTTADVDIKGGRVLIQRGKGGKGRVVPFGPQCAQALDRYLRLRRQHRLGSSAAFWLGDRGKGFSYYALHAALKQRAEAAGLVGFHPHLLRHTAAHRWLAAGGSETGLMTVAGWARVDMLQRYTSAQASNRAAEEARSLNLGDL